MVKGSAAEENSHSAEDLLIFRVSGIYKMQVGLSKTSNTTHLLAQDLKGKGGLFLHSSLRGASHHQRC